MIFNGGKKGSMLIAVVIIFAIIAGVAIAIVFRTLQGTQIAVGTEKGHQAYQNSDQKAELALNLINGFDKTPNWIGSWGFKIPENLDAYTFCKINWYTTLGGGTDDLDNLVCYARQRSGTGVEQIVNGNEPVGDPIGPYKVSELAEFTIPGAENNYSRSVKVPVPTRKSNTLNATITTCGASPCNGGTDPVGCAPPANFIKIMWPKIDLTVDKDFGGLQMVSTANAANPTAYTLACDAVSTPGTVGSCTWFRRVVISVNSTYTNLVNGDGTGAFKCSCFNEDESGNSWCAINPATPVGYLTIKVKNKNNFELDSLYLSNPAVKP